MCYFTGVGYIVLLSFHTVLSMQLKVLKGGKITFNRLKTYKYWSGLNTKLWNILIHSLTVTTTSATASFHWGTTVRISIALKVGTKQFSSFGPSSQMPASPGFRFPDTLLPAQLFYNSQHQGLAQEWHLNRLKVTCSSDGTAKPEVKSLRTGNTCQWGFLNNTTY